MIQGIFFVLALNCVYQNKDHLIDHFGQMERNDEVKKYFVPTKDYYLTWPIGKAVTLVISPEAR